MGLPTEVQQQDKSRTDDFSAGLVYGLTSLPTKQNFFSDWYVLWSDTSAQTKSQVVNLFNLTSTNYYQVKLFENIDLVSKTGIITF